MMLNALDRCLLLLDAVAFALGHMLGMAVAAGRRCLGSGR